MKTFELHRDADASGISGTGIVAFDRLVAVPGLVEGSTTLILILIVLAFREGIRGGSR